MGVFCQPYLCTKKGESYIQGQDYLLSSNLSLFFAYGPPNPYTHF